MCTCLLALQCVAGAQEVCVCVWCVVLDVVWRMMILLGEEVRSTWQRMDDCILRGANGLVIGVEACEPATCEEPDFENATRSGTVSHIHGTNEEALFDGSVVEEFDALDEVSSELMCSPIMTDARRSHCGRRHGETSVSLPPSYLLSYSLSLSLSFSLTLF